MYLLVTYPAIDWLKMAQGKLEDRIRKLCEVVLRAEQHELEAVFQQLRAALHEHNEILRKMAAELSCRRLPPTPGPPAPKRNGRRPN